MDIVVVNIPIRMPILRTAKNVDIVLVRVDPLVTRVKSATIAEPTPVPRPKHEYLIINYK